MAKFTFPKWFNPEKADGHITLDGEMPVIVPRRRYFSISGLINLLLMTVATVSIVKLAWTPQVVQCNDLQLSQKLNVPVQVSPSTVTYTHLSDDEDDMDVIDPNDESEASPDQPFPGARWDFTLYANRIGEGLCSPPSLFGNGSESTGCERFPGRPPAGITYTGSKYFRICLYDTPRCDRPPVQAFIGKSEICDDPKDARNYAVVRSNLMCPGFLGE